MNSKSAQGKQNQTSGLQLERTFPGHADRVHRIAWSPAEEVLATASEDGTLKIWKTDDDRPLQSFDGHTGPLRHVAWSPDGKHLACGAEDGTIIILGLQANYTCEPVQRLRAHSAGITGIAWSPDGKHMASCAHDDSLRIHETQAFREVANTPMNAIATISWSPRGQQIAVSFRVPTIHILKAPDCSPRMKFTADPTHALAWSPDGKLLANGDIRGRIHIRDMKTWQTVRVMEGHTAPINVLSFSRNGRFIASKSAGGSVRIWRLDTGTYTPVLVEPGSQQGMPAVAFHPTSALLATPGETERVIHVWRVDESHLSGSKPIQPENASASEHTENAPVPPSDAEKTIERKMASGSFDVFLSHNSSEKPFVRKIAIGLKEHGVLPWYDEWELAPGVRLQSELEQSIKRINSVVVFVGANGFGPWHDLEQSAYIRQFIKRKQSGCKIIPAILPGCDGTPELPLFLEEFKWVDFRQREPDPLMQLIWGITGKKN